MKWSRLQALVSALVIGDNVLPKDPESRVALLEYALEEISQKSEVIALEVLGDFTDMAREGLNGVNIRHFSLPYSDDDNIDIDPTLTFAAARLMASYISKDKYAYHRELALEIVKAYTDKIERFRRNESVSAIYGDRTYIDTGDTI